MIHVFYTEKKREESPFVSVNDLVKPKKQNNITSLVPPAPTGKKNTSKSTVQNRKLLQLKKENSGNDSLEGIGDNVANSKTDPIDSSYSNFRQEVTKRKEERDQKAEFFWAMKGVEAPLPSESNIRYRDSLAQKAGGSKTAIIQASLVVIGYDLGPYGPDKNGVDGYMGSLTEKALRDFRRAVGFILSDITDEQETMNALNAVVEAGLNKSDVEQLGENLGHTGLVQINLPRANSNVIPLLEPYTAKQFKNLLMEAQERGINVHITSMFRDTEKQEQLYRDFLDDKLPYTDTVAKPNTSPHEAGLAFDVSKLRLGKDFNNFIDLAKTHGFVWQGPGDPYHFGIPSRTAGYKDKYEAIKINQRKYQKIKDAH